MTEAPQPIENGQSRDKRCMIFPGSPVSGYVCLTMNKETQMKKITFFLFVLSFVLIGSQVMAAKRIMELKIGRGEAKVNVLEGSAQVLQAGKKTWRSLNLGDVLSGGDEVNTGPKARLELVLPDYSAVRFAGNSHFKVLQVDSGVDTVPRNMKFHIAIGRTWANVSKAVGKRVSLSCGPKMP